MVLLNCGRSKYRKSVSYGRTEQRSKSGALMHSRLNPTTYPGFPFFLWTGPIWAALFSPSYFRSLGVSMLLSAKFEARIIRERGNEFTCMIQQIWATGVHVRFILELGASREKQITELWYRTKIIFSRSAAFSKASHLRQLTRNRNGSGCSRKHDSRSGRPRVEHESLANSL
ncbi:hypothetical protein BDZ97DRAFT_646388 [Flammula alnicola]|nr:hypothetical protein BDZ97DRAFT_646388 [Flammula alnicola]